IGSALALLGAGGVFRFWLKTGIWRGGGEFRFFPQKITPPIKIRLGPLRAFGPLNFFFFLTIFLWVVPCAICRRYPRHFAQALQVCPPAGQRTFGEMSDLHKSFVWRRHWIPGFRQPPGELSRSAKRCLNSKGDEICLALVRLGPQP